MKIKLIFLLCLSFFFSNILAQTMETNIQGIVIKDYQCYGTNLVTGNLINRNSSGFKGKLRAKIIDSEGDIAYQGTTDITLGAQNGVSFSVYIAVKTCLSPNKVQITLEP